MALIFLALGCLVYIGILWPNAWFVSKYPVKGLDVSHHQGPIDWAKVAEGGRYRFVYLKATEGHDFVDDTFRQHWGEARKQNLWVGAYHFFSMRSSGEEQARHFMAIVPKEEQGLPPVIDVEIPLTHPLDRVRHEIGALSKALEAYYGQRPILYVTYETYQHYIEGVFADHDLWIRDVVKPPSLKGRPWLLWQYSNRGRIPGIETYTDQNVFNGSLEDFERHFN